MVKTVPVRRKKKLPLVDKKEEVGIDEFFSEKGFSEEILSKDNLNLENEENIFVPETPAKNIS
jgi:hypothetical protein